jgi:diaminopimelate decarboxylase
MGQLARDDLLAVFGAGAYGAVMASTYNTRPEAAEILVVDGTVHCLRPRRSLDDLLAAEINPLV